MQNSVSWITIQKSHNTAMVNNSHNHFSVFLKYNQPLAIKEFKDNTAKHQLITEVQIRVSLISTLFHWPYEVIHIY